MRSPWSPRRGAGYSGVLGAAIVMGASTVAPSARAQATPVATGTWTQAPSNPATGGPAFGLWLLTDGRVLSHGSALNNWEILTPDKTGSYANGTWKAAANSNYARGGAQEHVLKDGRFFEAGGEYIYAWPTGGSSSDYNNVEIYDPVADTWTLETFGLYDIGDTGSATLSDGRILDSTRASSALQIYDPVANTWTDPMANSPIGTGDENSWASLQNGGVLAVGYATAGAAVYNPATNAWTRTTVPSGFNTGDTGGISQMFDGRVFVYGLSGISYIYTPGATASDPGSWALGPAMLDGDEAEDEYSDTLPNGMVMGALVQVTYGPGVVLQQFDPTTNTVISAAPPPDRGNPYPIDYLNLPNGQVMVESEAADGPDWLFTPDGAPQDAWRPTVSSVAFNGGTTYTLTGTQLSGLINGGDEGDDMTMAENYPIVWLKDTSGNVYYCKSFNFSNMMPSNGDTPETCQFTTPAGLASGTYSLYVSAVGVQSKDPFSFTTDASEDAGPPSDAGAGETSVVSDTGTAIDTGPGGVADSASAEVGSTVHPDSGVTGGGPDTGSADVSSPSGQSSGCGCHTAKSRGLEGGALFGLGGLAMLVAFRRRRRASDVGR
jgi:MYXO-CTERM domain-containing protein